MLISVHLRGNNLNIHNIQTNSSCWEIKLAYKSIYKRLREISEEHLNQHKFKREQHDISTSVLGISVLICKNSFTCISSVYSRRTFSIYYIIFWHYLEVLNLKTTVFNKLGSVIENLPYRLQSNTIITSWVICLKKCICYAFKINRNSRGVITAYSKGKHLPQQAKVAQGVPGRLRPWIFLTFGTTRVVGRQPYVPASFTPEEIPGTHF